MSTMLEEKDHMLPYVMLERLTFIMVSSGVLNSVTEQCSTEPKMQFQLTFNI